MSKSNKKNVKNKETIITPTKKYDADDSNPVVPIIDEYQNDEENDVISDNDNEIDDEDVVLADDNIETELENENDVPDDVDNEIEGEEKETKEDKNYEQDNEQCPYKYAEDYSDSDAETEIIFDDDSLVQNDDIITNENRITKPFLTKYERVRLLGDRTQQLTLGAKPMIKNAENLPPKKIAELEIEKNVVPLILLRPLPNGKKEKWYIKELQH